MVDEVQRPEDDEPDIYDTWFDDEEESADDENYEDEDSSPESEEEVDAPEEEDPEESPETVDSEGDETEPEAQEDDPYKWVSELDPKFQKQVTSLVNRDRSNAGRAAAEARKRAEIQARLDRVLAEREAQQRVSAQGAPQKAAPTSQQIEDMDDEELKEFMEEFPSVAKSVEKLMARRSEQTREELLKQIRPIQQEAEAARVYERKQALRQEADRIFNTAETGVDLETVLQSDRWKEWVNTQPPGIKRIIQTSQDLDDVSRILEDFAEYTNRSIYEQWASQQEQDTSRADETAARRQGNLKGSTPKSRTAELSDRGRSASYESYFDEFAN